MSKIRKGRLRGTVSTKSVSEDNKYFLMEIPSLTIEQINEHILQMKDCIEYFGNMPDFTTALAELEKELHNRS